jgi:cytochrome P450
VTGEQRVDVQPGGATGVADNDPFEEFNRAMGADGDASPYPDFIAARATSAVHGSTMDISGGFDAGPEVFTAYSFEAVQTVLGDGETFSSAGYGDVMGVVMGRSILEMDEPEHRTYRSILQQAFTRQEMARWETGLVAPLINRMIDDFADEGRADLVRQLLFPFPVAVIAALLGLPAEDLPAFHRLAVELIGVMVDWDRSVASSAQLREYFSGIVADRRIHPADDMISVLATAEQDGQHLTDEEIYAFLRLLLPAGAETTYRSSSNLLFGLLTHREQLGALHADRSLMGQAIEEGIRWEPPLLIIARGATRDTEVCGTRIPEGSTIIVSLGSANHDESRWTDPERFDIFRERRPHIGFAHGPHMCLGMHLARMETQVVINTLLDRLPGLRLDPAAGDQYISGSLFRAPPRLDVVWD